LPLLRRSIAIPAVVACLAVLGSCRKAAPQQAAGPPVVPVSVATAARESVPSVLTVVGTVEASSVIQVKSQVPGELLRVHFNEGQNVPQGALLFEIDARPYQDALKQAEANLARDRAQVKQAEANLARDLAQAKNADIDAERFAILEKEGVAARTQWEQARTTAEVYRQSAHASQASIESARAAVEADQAAVARAKLDIGYCEIRSPIAGRTGNLLIHPGNLVKANDEPLVVIHQMAPAFVSFSVPEQHLASIRRLNAARPLPVSATAGGDGANPASGRLAVINNTIDPATGTIRLKATFDNRDGRLWPGQFVNVTLTLDTILDATVVPAEAVQTGQQGQFVWVVKPDKSAEVRPVKTLRLFDSRAAIGEGVAPGDVVVTDGHLRLFPGAKVRVVEGGKAGMP
jgi:membrane fusion protein, multidrug efflux system